MTRQGRRRARLVRYAARGGVGARRAGRSVARRGAALWRVEAVHLSTPS